MMTPVNMPVNGVVYYNAGMVPNAGDPQVHFASQSQPQPQLQPPQPQLQPPQQPPPPPQDFQHEVPHQQFQPLPTIKK